MEFLNYFQITSNFGKGHLINLTKVLNNDSNPGLVDQFMDIAKGRGHRIVSGHDLTNIPEVYERFGVTGVYDYFKHLSKDIMSPDGLPIPFAKEIQGTFGLSTGQTLDWLCLNIGDVLSGGVSIWHTKQTLTLLQSEVLTSSITTQILIGSGLKIFFSINNPNPVSLISGVVDLSALVYYGFPVYSSYVLSIFQTEITWSEILQNSIQVTGIGFSLSFLLEGARQIPVIIKDRTKLKECLCEVTKVSAVNGLISGAASIIADSTEKYITQNRTIKSIVAITSFTGLKYAYNRSRKPRGNSSSNGIVNMDLIPAF